MPEPELPLFVYGSLLDSRFASALLERPVGGEAAELLDHETAPLAGLGYPVVVPAPGGRVPGRLYRSLTSADYHRLDAYEGVGEGLYRRATATALAEGRDRPEPVCVYVPTGRTIRRYG